MCACDLCPYISTLFIVTIYIYYHFLLSKLYFSYFGGVNGLRCSLTLKKKNNNSFSLTTFQPLRP